MRNLLVIASGVCGFLLTCMGVEWVLTPDLPWMTREKVAYVAAHGNEYDALFFGSSRIASHVMTGIFDRVAAEKGVAIKSFNAGVPGMFTPQDSYMLDLVLASKPARVRWIFVELQPLVTGLPVENRDTQEHVYWHDCTRFWLLCQRLSGKQKRRHWQDKVQDTLEFLPNLGQHAVLFAKRLTNLGRGVPPLQRWIWHRTEPALDWRILGENGDGWVHPKDSGENFEKRGLTLGPELEKIRRIPPVREAHDRASQMAIDYMVAKIRRSGATPILVMPPNASRGSYFYPGPGDSQGVTIIDFCDPRKYPELFDLKNRVDGAHLSTSGAEIFTRLLAEQFVEAVRPAR